MYCPDYNIFRTRLICLTMYSDRDVQRQYVPKTQWINPLRYEVILFPKSYNQNAKMIVVNKGGGAYGKFWNFIYKAKARLGIQ